MALKIAKDLFDIFYPIGSYYETSNTNWTPSGAGWYGTWVEDTAGRVTVARDTNDSNFNNIGKTGGANSNSTTYTPAGKVGDTVLGIEHIPAHHHDVPYGANANGSSSGYAYAWSSGLTNSTNGKGWTGNAGTFNAGGGKGHGHPFTGTQATISISSLQKYITVRRWHRTA